MLLTLTASKVTRNVNSSRGSASPRPLPAVGFASPIKEIVDVLTAIFFVNNTILQGIVFIDLRPSAALTFRLGMRLRLLRGLRPFQL